MDAVWVENIKIQNFRSIENEEFDFDKTYNVIVGPNNAGKTNVIEAIDLVLGDIYLPKWEPTSDDFFQGDESKRILIQISLAASNADVINGISDGKITGATKLVCKYEYSSASQTFQLSSDGVNWLPKPYNEFSYWYTLEKHVFFLRVKSLRSLFEIAPMRWKSPLKFLKDKIIAKTAAADIDAIISKIDATKNELNKIGEIKKINELLLRISKEQIGINDIQTSMSATKKSDFLNSMQFIVDDGYASELGKKGFGTQNALIIGFFRLMAKYLKEDDKKYIIYGLDEPETGLHPHAQRQLLKSINLLSNYAQVIITTHSSNLVNVYESDKILRCYKIGGATKKYKISLAPQQKKILEVHGDYLEEMFFAKRILIVEGQTEKAFLLEASKKIKDGSLECSFDYNSVTVIDGEGDQLYFFVNIVKMLGVSFLIMIDRDKITGANYAIFIDNLVRCGHFSLEEGCRFKAISDIGTIESELKSKNVIVNDPFEEIIAQNLNANDLDSVLNAVNFVKTSWGYQNIEYREDKSDINKYRKFVVDVLKQKKRKAIAKAIALELSQDLYPAKYVELIKDISRLSA